MQQLLLLLLNTAGLHSEQISCGDRFDRAFAVCLGVLCQQIRLLVCTHLQASPKVKRSD
jgi:hypothetical protein